MDSANLAIIIKKVIKIVQLTGLTVVSTIYDQAPTNVAAINRLHKETLKKNKFGFVVGNQEIIPLYDVLPHLLKGLRNNLVPRDLHFVNDNKTKVQEGID